MGTSRVRRVGAMTKEALIADRGHVPAQPPGPLESSSHTVLPPPAPPLSLACPAMDTVTGISSPNNTQQHPKASQK